MYSIKTIVFIFLIILTACSNTTSLNKENLKYEDFKVNLKPNMSYTSVVNLFGKPKSDTGHGLHLLVYELSDSTKITVCCASYILYSSHQDKNGIILSSIL
jgi:hypothetical protein